MSNNGEVEETKSEFDSSKMANNAIDCVRNGDPNALKVVIEYFDEVLEGVGIFQFNAGDQFTYDQMFERLNKMLPCRNNIIRVISAIARFQEKEAFYKELHVFFERLLFYFGHRNSDDSNEIPAYDHYKLFASELFLYSVAALLKFGRFEQTNHLTSQGYYTPRYKNGTGEFIPFNIFNQVPDSIIAYYKTSWYEKGESKNLFFKERVLEPEFSFQELAQAEFVLHFISTLDLIKGDELILSIWAKYLDSNVRIFELFVRSESEWFFQKFALSLRGLSKTDLIAFPKEYEKIKASNSYFPPLPNYLHYFIGLDKIGSRP